VGRLLRKKTVKKKKKPAGDLHQTAPVNGSENQAAVDESQQVEKKSKIVEVRKPATVSRPMPVQPKDNFVTRSFQFLREVKMELKKVTWPSRKQTIGSTVVVLVLVTIIAFFLGVVDIGLSSIVKVVLR
jgi:preprotein translocase subunit SecE